METTEIYHFDIRKGKRVKIKDMPLVGQFTFSRHEFFVVKVGSKYAVCVSDNGYPVMVKHYDAKGHTPGMVMSEFRSGYLKNGITDYKLAKFLSEPLTYRNLSSENE